MKEKINSVMARIDKVIAEANVQLAEVTENGFPFSLGEVVISASMDSAGIYVHSGNTPICAMPRRGDPEDAVKEITRIVRDVVEDVKASVERRGSLREDAELLRIESEHVAKAADALKAAGLDASSFGIGSKNEAADAVIEAAKRAVKEANKYRFLGVVRYNEYKMRVVGFLGGLVIMAGDKPVLVTRYPKVSGNKLTERTVAFIESDIAALSDSRRRYFERVRLEMDREERLHEIARKLDSANDMLMAASM